MTKHDYLDQLSEIKSIMERRTKFNSLSGISGILAGTYAIIGSLIAYKIVANSDTIAYKDLQQFEMSNVVIRLFLLAFIILLSAVITGLYFSTRKANKESSQLWTPAAKKVLANFMIPFVTGALFVLALIWKGHVFLVAPSSLIFYGLSLVIAANYTFSEVKSLGLLIIVTGLIGLLFPGYGIFLWAFGFGVLHIIYGTIMYLKYEK